MALGEHALETLACGLSMAATSRGVCCAGSGLSVAGGVCSTGGGLSLADRVGFASSGMVKTARVGSGKVVRHDEMCEVGMKEMV